MAVVDKTPPINATGLFELKSPFTIQPVVYRCEAIEGFESLADGGINVFAAYYNPKGLSQSTYQQDLEAGINIITLMSSEGPTIHVPSSYIEKFPTDISSPYNRVILSIDLGPLPDTLELTQLQNDLQDLATDVTGVATDVSLHRIPMAAPVSKQQADQMETSRITSVVNRLSSYAGLVNTGDQLNTAKSKITELEGVVRNLSSLV